MNQHKLSNLEGSWEEIVFDLTEYTPIHFQSILQSFNQNFNQDFVNELPLLDENFILNILNN